MSLARVVAQRLRAAGIGLHDPGLEQLRAWNAITYGTAAAPPARPAQEGRNMHHCPGPGCDARVPYEMLACSRHWYQVPAAIRRAVYRAWADGAGAGSDAHTAALEAAIARMRPLQRQRDKPADESQLSQPGQHLQPAVAHAPEPTPIGSRDDLDTPRAASRTDRPRQGR